ncbi:MAG: hypothetical protein E2O79_07540 [Caldithrix sp.]|nr:MAG: hypothetical protein E2O79_07540 [Caldithrix sp.]
MMNLNNNPQPLLDDILARLDGSTLYQEIDLPLDLAFYSFAFETPGQIDRQQFKNILTRFYQHLSQVGLKRTAKLTECQAFEEVIWILEHYYLGNKMKGYDGAFYDAFKYGEAGMEFILEAFVGFIKSIERTKYISWIVHTSFDPSDWFVKKKLVEDILARYGDIFPADVIQLTPAQLIPYLEDLLLTVTSQVPG